MKSKQQLRKGFTSILAAAFLWTMLPLSAAQAAIVGTEAAVNLAQHAQVQSQLQQLLARDDIRQALVTNGIDLAEAQARVETLTPAEARQLAGKLDAMPAAGNSLVGALVFIFVLLLVTDLLGLTSVYPFTH